MVEIIYYQEAKKEIKEAAAYYEKHQKGLGQSFLLSIEYAVKILSSNPLLYRKLRGRFRRCLVEKFPYGIIYIIDKNEIYIVAVMHLKRNPGYWIRRT